MMTKELDFRSAFYGTRLIFFNQIQRDRKKLGLAVGSANTRDAIKCANILPEYCRIILQSLYSQISTSCSRWMHSHEIRKFIIKRFRVILFFEQKLGK